MSDFDFDKFAWSDRDVEPFLRKAKRERIKIATIRDLAGFQRVSTNLLVRKSDQSFWELAKDSKGEVVIERVLDDGDHS